MTQPPQYPGAPEPEEEPRYGVRLPPEQRPVPPQQQSPAFGQPQYGQQQPPTYGQPPYGQQQPTNPYGQQQQPYPGGQQQWNQPQWGQDPYATGGIRPGQRNGLAVWSLVLGIVGFCLGPASLGGIVLGFLARDAVKKGQATNGGLATAGLVVSVVALVAWIGYLIWAGVTGFDPFEALQVS